MGSNSTTRHDLINLETVQNKKKSNISILEYYNILINISERKIITSGHHAPIAPYYFHHHALDTLRDCLL